MLSRLGGESTWKTIVGGCMMCFKMKRMQMEFGMLAKENAWMDGWMDIKSQRSAQLSTNHIESKIVATTPSSFCHFYFHFTS